MKFYQVTGETTEKSTVLPEYKEAREFGAVRVGKTMLFFREGTENLLYELSGDQPVLPQSHAGSGEDVLCQRKASRGEPCALQKNSGIGGSGGRTGDASRFQSGKAFNGAVERKNAGDTFCGAGKIRRKIGE